MNLFTQVFFIFTLLLQALFNGAQDAQKDSRSQDLTSIAMSVDDWLFAEDLFPGHIIPQNTAHHDAVKLLSKLLDDPDILEEAYKKFRLQHGKEAEDDVKFDARKLRFKDNLHLILQHNLQHDAGHLGFQLGVNQFADMSREEWSHFLGANDKVPIHAKTYNATGPYGPLHPPPQPPVANGPPSSVTSAFPISFDLRDHGVVTSIKNQKKCGSCVHFAHGGFMETLFALKNNGTHINVSEQMMLDCALPEYGYENNAGCNGNIMEDSGQFLCDHGVTTEDVYQYTAKVGTCDKEGKHIIAKLKDYWHVEPTVDGFKSVLCNLRQPIAAAYYVHPTFMLYRTGIFDACAPPHGYIGGHAVLVVGYGQFFDKTYFIVKNSWGTKWGEAGYFKYIAGSSFCRFERWGFTGTLLS